MVDRAGSASSVNYVRIVKTRINPYICHGLAQRALIFVQYMGSRSLDCARDDRRKCSRGQEEVLGKTGGSAREDG